MFKRVNSYTPIIIIGAPRSGTNMLRDILTKIPDFVTWDCDEINAVWQYGNVKYSTDELKPSMLNEKIIKYIRKSFEKESKKLNVENIVEKTCANSLRPAFVDTIFPDAKFIFIYRDGRDAIASALKRWHSKIDLKYTLQKARYVPIRNIPTYSYNFFKNRLLQIFSSENRLSSWGPRYDGIDDDLKNLPLHAVAAKQWKKSIEISYNYLSKIDNSRVFSVKYEDFVKNPTSLMQQLLEYFQLEEQIDVNYLVKDVSSKSVGKWKKDLTKIQDLLII